MVDLRDGHTTYDEQTQRIVGLEMMLRYCYDYVERDPWPNYDQWRYHILASAKTERELDGSSKH